MNFCSNCGNNLNDKNKCINCGDSVKNINDEKSNKRKIIISKIFAWISLILAIMPEVVFFGTCISAQFVSDSSGHVVIIMLYAYFALVPVALGSLICGIVSCIKKTNIVALIGFLLNSLPLIFSVFILYAYFS